MLFQIFFCISNLFISESIPSNVKIKYVVVAVVVNVVVVVVVVVPSISHLVSRRKPNLFHVKPEQEIRLQLISAAGKKPRNEQKRLTKYGGTGGEWKALFHFLE